MFYERRKIMDIKKGDKTIFIPALIFVAGAVVLGDVTKTICETIQKTHK